MTGGRGQAPGRAGTQQGATGLDGQVWVTDREGGATGGRGSMRDGRAGNRTGPGGGGQSGRRDRVGRVGLGHRPGGLRHGRAGLHARRTGGQPHGPGWRPDGRRGDDPVDWWLLFSSLNQCLRKEVLLRSTRVARASRMFRLRAQKALLRGLEFGGIEEPALMEVGQVREPGDEVWDRRLHCRGCR